jgi:hypothetical protein
MVGRPARRRAACSLKPNINLSSRESRKNPLRCRGWFLWSNEMNNHQFQKCNSIVDGTSLPTQTHEADLSRLPNDLSRAIQEGWQIAPVSAHSRFASLTQSLLAAPSNDPAQIASWAVTFPGANFCVLTGDFSGLVILEVNHESGQDSLCEICGDTWDFLDTLKFSDRSGTWFLFHHREQRLVRLSSRIEGIQVHAAGKLVFLPPSTLVSGVRLVYGDIDAKVLDCPRFLLAPEVMPLAAGAVIRFPPCETFRS